MAAELTLASLYTVGTKARIGGGAGGAGSKKSGQVPVMSSGEE